MDSTGLEHIKALTLHSNQTHIVFDAEEQVVWSHPVQFEQDNDSLSSLLSPEAYSHLTQTLSSIEEGQSQFIYAMNQCYVIRRVHSYFWLEEITMSLAQVTPPMRKRSMLGQLLGDFAHSISNPLAVIQGRLELANLRAKDSVQKNLFAMLYGQVLRISSQLQSIQAISSQRNRSIDKINIRNWLEGFFEVPHRSGHAVRMDVPSMLHINTDDHYFELVLENLIQRCQTVMTPNTEIKLIVQELSKHIQILIEYKGATPSLTDIQAIEKAGLEQTLPHRSVGYQIICVLILIRSFDAQFSLEATDEGGRFMVQLPIQDSQNQLQSDLQLGLALNILLIDDNVELAVALRDFLMHEGHFVQQVNSAEQAMKHLNKNWDCIILDLQLPKLSGEELFAYIKLHYPSLTSKVVCISGNPPEDPQLKKRYLNKPFTLSQLIASIFAPNS